MTTTSSTLAKQPLKVNTYTHTPSNNTVMQNVLSELEAKDGKINALESKLDEMVSLLNSLVAKTNAQ